MTEPLTNSTNLTSFLGKTYNYHPQWYNQPLRLSKEQKKDPLPVLDDFFQCYHLNEVRQTLWEWLTDILSSQRSISIEPLDRNNHIYFYEKLEGIVEAAYVIKRKIHKQRQRKEKRRLKIIEKYNQQRLESGLKHATIAQLKPETETWKTAEQFNKRKQLNEFADENPMYVITEIFKSAPLSVFKDQIKDWRYLAVAATGCTIYEKVEQIGQLATFIDELLELTEALFIVCMNTENSVLTERLTENDKPTLLSQDQIANPMKVVAGFYEKYPLEYIIRELDDCLEASLCFSGSSPENMGKLDALNTYRTVLCLIKSAHRLMYPKTA
ncbi:hypothetical protein [Longitalea arenae]|uniref:hypothetical protein n=1 Tax=Longitalea arenae TaxID=2812558 RepID=UPI0019686FCB|nr:hypothetical protein [Longitalea arenae]